MRLPEISYKKILYCTDLSETGRHAFGHAASLAFQYKAELTVLHVVDEGPEMADRLIGYMDKKLWEEIKQRDLEEARDILKNRKRDNVVIKECVGDYCRDIVDKTNNSPYVTYDIIVELGNPVEKILEQIVRGAYDLLVMGNIAHNSIAMLGSTVQRILRRVSIPVMVVRIPKA